MLLENLCPGINADGSSLEIFNSFKHFADVEFSLKDRLQHHCNITYWAVVFSFEVSPRAF